MDSAGSHGEGSAVHWALADPRMLCLLSQQCLSVTVSPGWVGWVLFPGPLPSPSQLDSRKHEGARLMATHLLIECGQSTERVVCYGCTSVCVLFMHAHICALCVITRICVFPFLCSCIQCECVGECSWCVSVYSCK